MSYHNEIFKARHFSSQLEGKLLQKQNIPPFHIGYNATIRKECKVFPGLIWLHNHVFQTREFLIIRFFDIGNRVKIIRKFIQEIRLFPRKKPDLFNALKLGNENMGHINIHMIPVMEPSPPKNIKGSHFIIFPFVTSLY
jgi:hypothetical protein